MRPWDPDPKLTGPGGEQIHFFRISFFRKTNLRFENPGETRGNDCLVSGVLSCSGVWCCRAGFYSAPKSRSIACLQSSKQVFGFLAAAHGMREPTEDERPRLRVGGWALIQSRLPHAQDGGRKTVSNIANKSFRNLWKQNTKPAPELRTPETRAIVSACCFSDSRSAKSFFGEPKMLF